METYQVPFCVSLFCQSSLDVYKRQIQESALSFLGMGVQPPEASWGNILYAAQSITVLSSRPWLWVPPGILLVLTVSSINFIGDGIRDALDAKTKIKKK